jgi:outer membrane protein assembly factor BamC
MLRVVVVLTLLINLMACSSEPEWKGIYSEGSPQKKSTKLEVPPDLSEPDSNEVLALPNIAGTDSTYLAYTNSGLSENTGVKVADAKPTGIKVIRDGASQWLEINTNAEKLWPQLKIFFNGVGFEIKSEDKALGVMDTNWLESRAALPTNWFSKILNRISSTGLRDKYRARLEKTDNPEITLLFITHQGLKEHAADTSSGEALKLWWETRSSDPELEAEMYQRFLIFSDVSKADSMKLVKNSIAKERTQIIDKDETKMLQVGEAFDRTWRRVGIALDRIGLFVEDRNRSNGLYYLKITDDFREKIKEDKSWLSSLFSDDSSAKLKDRYLLNVNDEKGTSLISVYETSGAKADIRFVNQLLSDLKLYLD